VARVDYLLPLRRVVWPKIGHARTGYVIQIWVSVYIFIGYVMLDQVGSIARKLYQHHQSLN